MDSEAKLIVTIKGNFTAEELAEIIRINFYGKDGGVAYVAPFQLEGRTIEVRTVLHSAVTQR